MCCIALMCRKGERQVGEENQKKGLACDRIKGEMAFMCGIALMCRKEERSVGEEKQTRGRAWA